MPASSAVSDTESTRDKRLPTGGIDDTARPPQTGTGGPTGHHAVGKRLLAPSGTHGVSVVILPNPMLVALQTLPFLVTLAALYFIIFKPMLAYLAARENLIEGDRAEAARMEKEVEAKLEEVEKRLTAARAEVTELRMRLRAEATEAADARIREAQAAADAKMTEAIAKIHAERDAARAELAETARSIAADIAGRVLGRSVAVG